MKKFILFFAVILLNVVITSVLFAADLKITIIYDNFTEEENLVADWGFSCLIEGVEKTILFDTGTKPEIFLNNMKNLDIDPKVIDIVVISHNHGDHTGGLKTFLEKNSNIKLYMPASTPVSYISRLKETGAEVIAEKESMAICKDVFLSGETGVAIKEQAMYFKTSEGIVVLTGCAHPGIVGIAKKAGEILDEDIYAVLGGFHLFQSSTNNVKDIISEFKNMGVLKSGATHCTGEASIKLFRDAFKENFIELGAGRVIKFEK